MVPKKKKKKAQFFEESESVTKREAKSKQKGSSHANVAPSQVSDETNDMHLIEESFEDSEDHLEENAGNNNEESLDNTLDHISDGPTKRFQENLAREGANPTPPLFLVESLD